MNYKKFERIKVHKEIDVIVSRDFPHKHRKNHIRKLTTKITREQRGRSVYSPFYRPPDYSINKVIRI